MNTSESINEIAAAMAKAQSIIENPTKDKENPHFKSKYADLASGLDCIRPALSAHGISFIQATEVTDDGVVLKTRLIHCSGQWIESSYPVSKFAPHQQMGAALTYAKRQALFALVGVCGDDDDDGNAANALDTRTTKATTAPVRRIERKAPDAVTLSAEDSGKALSLLIKSLDFCGSRESLHEWAKSNKATIDSLTEDDRQAARAAYRAKETEIQTPPAAAAE